MRLRSTESIGGVSKLVAAEVRAEMGRQRISQKALADKLGWTQPRLSRRLYEAGKRPLIPLEVDELVIVAAVLGVPVSQLLPEEVAA